MIYKLRSKTTGEILNIDANSPEEAVAKASSSSRGGQPQGQTTMEKLGSTLWGVGKGLASPFINTFNRVSALGEETARYGDVNKAEKLTQEAQRRMAAGDRSPEVKQMLDEAIRISQGADYETKAQTNKALTDPLQITKDSAALLSWGVPVSKATKLGIGGGGALAGAAGGFGYSKETTPEGLLGSTALGAATGFASAKIINKLFPGKAAKVPGEKEVTNKTEQAGYNTVRGVVRPKSGGGFKAIGQEDELIDIYLSKGGAGKSANEGRYLVESWGNSVEKKISDLTDDLAFNPKSSETLKTWVKNRVTQEGEFFTKVDPDYLSYVDEATDRLFKPGKSFDFKQILGTKSEARRLLGKTAVNKMNSSTPVAMTSRDMALADVYDAVNNMVYDLGPDELKPLIRELAQAHTIADNLIPAGKEAANLFGIPIPGVASGLQKVQTKIGKGMLDVGKFFKGGTEGSEPLLNTFIGGKIPAAASAANTMRQLQEQPQEQGYGQQQEPQQNTQPTQGTNMKLTPMMMFEAAMTLPKEDYARLKEMYQMQQDIEKIEGKSSSDNAKAITDAATAAYKLLAAGSVNTGMIGGRAAGWGAQLGVGGDQETLDFNLAVDNIYSAIAKIRGGTALTADEKKLLNRYLPQTGDSKQRVESKLRYIIQNPEVVILKS
jgi:hypothetical protein